MDPSAQNTLQQPQQQARPVVEPPVRDPSVQPQPAAPQAPQKSQAISVGTEMGRFQITTDEEEDDTGSSQQYVPLQSQTPSEIIHEPTTEKVVTQAAPLSEIIHQPSSEKIVTQAVPQEMAQQSVEQIQPAVPEVEVPKEISHLVQKSPVLNNPFLPPELQNAGVKHTIPQVAVPQNEFGIKELPLPDEEAKAKAKAFRSQDSMKWLAAKVHYYWRKINPEVYK